MKKKPNPQDATKGVSARARDRAIAKAIKPILKRLDLIESLIDRGLGPFRKDT